MNWKNIDGYDGYQVSDTGKVRTHNKTTYTKRHGTRHWKDRILVPKVSISNRNRGDERVDLWKDGKPHTMKVSRLVAFTFLGGDINDSSLTVNHIDGDFTNNNLENLELVPLGENIRHGFENGLYGTAKTTRVTNKRTGESTVFKSMCKASVAVGKYPSYVSSLNRKGIFDDEMYVYEIG